MSDRSTFFGKDTSYDYLKDAFNERYTKMHPRATTEKRDNAFQRYLMTGEGPNASYGRKVEPDKNDKVIGRLFEAGIPRSQLDYYANKADITNFNSENDADRLIAAYNADERYQGPTKSKKKSKPSPQEFKDDFVTKLTKDPKTISSPAMTIGDLTASDGSIVAPIQQDNDIENTGNNNTIEQKNSIAQTLEQMRREFSPAFGNYTELR